MEVEITCGFRYPLRVHVPWRMVWWLSEVKMPQLAGGGKELGAHTAFSD